MYFVVVPVVPLKMTVSHVSISALEPSTFTPVGHAASHGESPAPIVTADADARSVGRYVSTACSDLELFSRPFVLPL